MPENNIYLYFLFFLLLSSYHSNLSFSLPIPASSLTLHSHHPSASTLFDSLCNFSLTHLSLIPYSHIPAALFTFYSHFFLFLLPLSQGHLFLYFPSLYNPLYSFLIRYLSPYSPLPSLHFSLLNS